MTTLENLKENRNEIIAYLKDNNVDVKKSMDMMVEFLNEHNNWMDLADLVITKQKTVYHSKFGKGLVIENNSEIIKVDFNGTIKELSKTYANLKMLDGSAFESIETNENRNARVASDNFNKPRYEHSTSLLKSFL